MIEDRDLDFIAVHTAGRRGGRYKSYADAQNNILGIDLSNDEDRATRKFLRRLSWRAGIVGNFYKSKIISKNGIRFNTALKIYEDIVFHHNYWVHCKSAAILATEHYVCDDSQKTSLNLSKTAISSFDSYVVISCTLRYLFSFPNDIVSITRKARVVNCLLKDSYGFAKNILASPEYVSLVNEQFCKHLELVGSSPEMDEYAKNFIESITNGVGDC